jgi:hypothetical protein
MNQQSEKQIAQNQMENNGSSAKAVGLKVALIVVFLTGFTLGAFFGGAHLLSTSYTAIGAVADIDTLAEEIPKDSFKVTHIPTPQAVKTIYMSQCVAGTPSFRDKLVALVEETELNSIMIDIKDFSGGIAFPTEHPDLAPFVSDACGARDMREFIGTLHDKGIYVIGRITVFQDPLYTSMHPELSVWKNAGGEIWKDHKGLSFIDVGAKPFWDYIVTLSEESYAIGFDELNYDYIRFPSDGNMKEIYYPFSEEVVTADPNFGKAIQLEKFFKYLSTKMDHTGAVLSADLFGMTATNPDDLNIGQVLERTLPYFDYVMPMVYPSHYPNGFRGYQNPAIEPYNVVNFSMSRAVERANELASSSSTPTWIREKVSKNQLRPWLQDFDLGARYTPEMVRAQIQATYDAGLNSWALWDAGNTYTKEALISI